MDKLIELFSTVLAWQWVLLIAISGLLFFLSPWVKKSEAFFKGSTGDDRKPGFWLLLASLIISWIFAKSIDNAANLSQAFGIFGGIAYAVYYLSFLIAGWLLVSIRKDGHKSIAQFLLGKHGRTAVWLFSLMIAVRLFNEVWSNTIVIGTFFGEQSTTPYYLAIAVFTLLTLAYSIKGGLRSSFITDAIQLVLFSCLLIVILVILFPAAGAKSLFAQSEWTMAMGGNLFFAAFIQIFSYPFHDPVMTDRAFISSKRVTRKAFIWASVIGFIAIVFFSLIGTFAKANNLDSPAAVKVGQYFGVVMTLVVNVIMVTSAASTLDSTFSSASRLIVKDLIPGRPSELKLGRLVMVAFVFVGTIPVFFAPSVIDATTVSGTMAIGLAPVFLFHRLKAPKWSFHLSFLAGFFVGMLLLFSKHLPDWLWFTEGKYRELLALNIYGTVLVFVLYFLPFLFREKKAA